jgi:hypothetical protein
MLEEQVYLSGALTTFVDSPDDQRLTSTGISARPDTIDAASVRLRWRSNDSSAKNSTAIGHSTLTPSGVWMLDLGSAFSLS